MAKKNKTDLDEFDFDDDIFGDLDGEEGGSGKTPKSGPIRILSTSFAEGARDALLEPSKIQELTRAVLPKSYSSTFDAADAVADTGRRLYDTAASELKPIMPTIRKAAGKLYDKTDGLAPKGLRKVLKDFSERGDSTYRSPTQEETDNTQISDELGSIFKATSEADAKRSGVERAERYLRQRVEDKQASSLYGELSRLSNSASRIVAYQDAVTYKYQQKTLENSYRQTFMLRDILGVQRTLHSELKEGIKALVHNTATPDFQKKGVGDSMHESMRDRLIGGAQNQAQKFTGEFFKRISSGATDRLKESLGTMVGAIEQGQSASEMMADAEEMGLEGGKLGMMGSGLGGMVADYLAPKLLQPFKVLLGRSKGVNKGGDKMQNMLSQIPEKLQRMKDDGVDDISSFSGWMKQMLLDAMPDFSLKKTVGGSAIMKADQPVPWDNMSRRSLVEILPGFLSRIHHEVANIRIGLGFDLKTDRTVYNADSNKFDTVKGATSDAKKRIFESGMVHSVQSSVNAVVDHSDDGTLTPAQRKLMAAKILEASQKAQPIDETLFSKERMGKDVSEKDRQAIEKSFTSTLNGEDGKLDYKKLNERVDKHIEIRKHTQDPAALMRIYRETGNIDQLRQLGIIRSNGFSEEVDYDAYNKLLLEGEGIAKKKKPEKESWFKKNEREYMGAWDRKSEEFADWAESKEMYQKVTSSVSKLVAAGVERAMKVVNKFQQKDDDPFESLMAEFDVDPLSEEASAPGSSTPPSATAPKTRKRGGRGKKAKEPPKKARFKNGRPNKHYFRDGQSLSEQLQQNIKTQGASLGTVIADTLDTTKKGVKRARGKASKVYDVYRKDGAKPALEAAKIEAGEYYDEASGKVIRSINDIKGPVVDSSNKVILSAQDMANGVRDEHGQTIDAVVKAGQSYLNRAKQSRAGKALARGMQVLGQKRDQISSAVGKLQDLYAEGGKEALIDATRLQAGEYRDQLTKQVIRKIEDINGPITDADGNVVVSAEQIARGVFTKAGERVDSITKRAAARARGLKAAAVQSLVPVSPAAAPNLQPPTTATAQAQQDADQKCQCEEHLVQITELNANQLALLDQIYQTMTQLAVAGNPGGAPGAPGAKPGFMRRNFGRLGGGLAGVGRGVRGLGRGFGTYVGGVYRGLWGGTKMAVGGLWSTAKGTAGAAWGLASPGARRARRQSDVYVKGDMQNPVLFKRLMAEGAYLDMTTNKPVHTVDDIKGPVKNLKTGNIDLTQEDFDKGITDHVGMNIGTRVKNAAKSVFGAFAGYSVSAFALPFKLAGQAVKLIGKTAEMINEGQDVYLKGRLDKAVMLNKDIKAGKFFSAKTGKPIRSYKQVDGEIFYFDPVTKERRVAITEEEARSLPLVNWRGKPIRSIGQRGMGLIGSAAGVAADAAMGMVKGYAKVVGSVLGMGRDMVVGTARGIGNFFNPKGRKGVRVGADERQIQLLEDIFGILQDRLVKPKKLRAGSWQDQFDKRNAAAAEVAKEKREKAGDKGGLLGGLRSLFGKGKKGLMGLFGGDDEEDLDEDDDDGSLLDDVADGADIVDAGGDARARGAKRRAAKKRLKRMRRARRRGKFGRLGSLFSRGGAATGAAGTAAAGAKVAGGAAGAASGAARGGLRALPIAGAALGVGLGAKQIWDVQHDESLTGDQKRQGTGGAVGGMAGGLAGAAAGAAVGSVIPVAGTLIGGAIGGMAGYMGGDWLGSKIAGNRQMMDRMKLAGMLANPVLGLGMMAHSKLTGGGKSLKNNTFSQLRVAQYGVSYKDSDKVDKLQELEAICEGAVKMTPQGAQLDQSTLDPDAIFKLFEVDSGGFMGFFKKRSESRVESFTRWFNMRFKPVFLAWKTALHNATNGAVKDLADAWDKPDYEQRKKILAGVKVPEDIYNLAITPFFDSELETGTRNIKPLFALAALEIDGNKSKGVLRKKIDTFADKYIGKVKNAYSKAMGTTATGLEWMAEKTKYILPGASWLTKMAAKLLRKGEKGLASAEGEGKPLETGLAAGTQLTPLQSIRYRAYGLKAMQTDRVNAVYILEKNVMKQVTFAASGAASFNKTGKSVFNDYASYFGIAVDEDDKKDAWIEWFNKRFLPALLAFASGARAFVKGPIDIVNIDKMLKPAQMIGVGRVVIAAKYKRKLIADASIWSYLDSPWGDDEGLNDDINSTRRNIEQLEAMAKDEKMRESSDAAKPKPVTPTAPKAVDPKKPAPKPNVPPSATDSAHSPAPPATIAGAERDLAREADTAYWASKGIDATKVEVKDGRLDVASLARGKSIKGLNTEKLWEKVAPLIASGESMGGKYDAQNGVPGSVMPGLTGMSIGAVLGLSKQIGASDGAGPKTGAAGKYQFIPKTLVAAVKMAKLKLTDLFSAENQEKMGRALFDMRISRGMKGGVTGILDQLAMEWASLPSPTKGGASWYEGDSAGNRAHGGMERLRELIEAVTGSTTGGSGGAGSTGSLPDFSNVQGGSQSISFGSAKPSFSNVQGGSQSTEESNGFWNKAGRAARDAVTAPSRMAANVAMAPARMTMNALTGAGKWLGNAAYDTKEYLGNVGSNLGSGAYDIAQRARGGYDAAAGYAKDAVSDVVTITSSMAGSVKAAKAAAVAAMRAGGRSVGKCAKFVSDALLAAGYKFAKQASAYMYVSNGILTQIGFKQIDPKSTPKTGDVMVYDRTGRHPHGHIQIWDGKQWVSDFKQKGVSPYREQLPCTLWRDAGAGEAANSADFSNVQSGVQSTEQIGVPAAAPPDISKMQGLQAVAATVDQPAQENVDRDQQVQQLNQQTAYQRSMEQQRGQIESNENTQLAARSLDVQTKQLETQQQMRDTLIEIRDAVKEIKIPEPAAPAAATGSEEADSKKNSPATRRTPGFDQRPTKSPMNVRRAILSKA